MPSLSEIRRAHVNRERAKYNAMRASLSALVVRNKTPSSPRSRSASASPRRSPNRALARRSPSGSPVNLYGGRRSPRKTLNRAQVRRIVSLIVSIMIALVLARIQNKMSPSDARKYGGYVVGIFKKFLSIVKYFTGYEKQIEAGAAALFTVLARKFSMGTLRLNTTNLMVGIGAYTFATRTGSGVSNFINHMNKRSGSWWQMPGTQAALNEKIRAALVTMLAWMISSLNFFAVTNVADIIRAELRHRGILGPSRQELENAGRRALGMNRHILY
jgi:hypothetical protein